MKKEMSPGVVLGAIVALVAVVVLVIVLIGKSDPASQAPNPPPRFDPGARRAETEQTQAQHLNGGPNASRPGASPAPAGPR